MCFVVKVTSDVAFNYFKMANERTGYAEKHLRCIVCIYIVFIKYNFCY